MSFYTNKKLLPKLAPLLTTFKVDQILRPFLGGGGLILMFHRVLPAAEEMRIHNHLSLEITPEHFEKTIQFFQKRKYTFYSLNDLYDRLASGKLDKKFVLLTFDDGYKDNYEYVLPLIRKYQVPITIYVAIGMPEHQAILWWYNLEEMVIHLEEVNFEWEGNTYHIPCKTTEEKEGAFAQLRAFLNANFTFENHMDLYKSVFGRFFDNPYAPVEKVSMTWEQVQEISREPLVTIGAHTINHYPLAKLPASIMEEEIDRSRAILQEKLDMPIEHFAYPYGKNVEAGVREFEVIKRLGFKTATTTRVGNIYNAHKDHCECLPRINLNRITDDNILKLQSSGVLPFLKNKGRRIITT